MEQDALVREDDSDVDADDYAIRRARREDLPAVRSLWEDLMEIHGRIHDYYRVRPGGSRVWGEYIARHLRGGDGRLWIGEGDGAVIGVLLAYISDLQSFYRLERIGVLSDIAVAAGHRGRGVGRRLVETASAWFGKKGVDRAITNIVPANSQARAFWNAMGFDVLSEYRMRRL